MTAIDIYAKQQKTCGGFGEIMNCEMLDLGLCDDDFNCQYFKHEPIPSRIKCFYEGFTVNYPELVEICMGYFREHVKVFTLDKDSNNPKMDWEKIKTNQRKRGVIYV